MDNTETVVLLIEVGLIALYATVALIRTLGR
jgi:hypothetical protein